MSIEEDPTSFMFSYRNIISRISIGNGNITMEVFFSFLENWLDIDWDFKLFLILKNIDKCYLHLIFYTNLILQEVYRVTVLLRALGISILILHIHMWTKPTLIQGYILVELYTFTVWEWNLSKTGLKYTGLPFNIGIRFQSYLKILTFLSFMTNFYEIENRLS